MNDTDQDFTKVYVKLNDAGAVATESPWVNDFQVDSENPERATGRLANTCFHVRLAWGDTVELTRRGEDWQVTDLVQRNPGLHSWAMYLVTQDEIEADTAPRDDMVWRERWVTIEHEITTRLPDLVEKMGFEGALGFAPVVMAQVYELSDDDLGRFVDLLEELENRYPVTVFHHTSPDDALFSDEPILGEAFTAEPLDEHLKVDTDYVAADDPFWTDTFGEDAQWVVQTVERCVQHDPRVARDLEAGRYDRVMLLLERLFTDPQDLAPLEKPIWED